MKKTLRLSVILLLLFCAFCACASAEAPLYVALGDSIADGYALPGYTAPGCAPSDSFPVRVAENTGLTLVPLAVSGLDTDGLLYLLTQNNDCRAAVSGAGLITLTIGSNDILIPAVNNSSLGSFFSGEAADAEDPSSFFTLLMTIDAELNSAEMRAMFEGRVEHFKQNWNTIISTIRAYNPRAEIIATAYYNPYAMLEYKGNGMELHIGGAVQGYLDAMNDYICSCPLSTEYYVADISSVSTNVNIGSDGSGSFNLDPHPDIAGHALIAQTVSDILTHIRSCCNFINIADYDSMAYSDVSARDLETWPIRESTELGLIKGYPDGTFHPSDSLTVAEALTIAARFYKTYSGDPVVFDQSFGDHWYETYILYCIKKGIISWHSFGQADSFIYCGEWSSVLYRCVEPAAFAKAQLRSGLSLPDSDIPYSKKAWASVPAGSYPNAFLGRGAALYPVLRAIGVDF